jgi:Flp pilus assembly protein TadG
MPKSLPYFTNRQALTRVRPAARSRRGISTLWILLFVPAFATLFCMVVEISNVWLARVELENALEAAALAGVKSWGEGSSATAARNDAKSYAAVNTARGVAVPLDDSNITLGGVTGTTGNFTLDAGATPVMGVGPDFGLRVQRVITVNSLCASVFGATVGPYQVTAQVDARFNKSNARPELIRVTTFTP